MSLAFIFATLALAGPRTVTRLPADGLVIAGSDGSDTVIWKLDRGGLHEVRRDPFDWGESASLGDGSLVIAEDSDAPTHRVRWLRAGEVVREEVVRAGKEPRGVALEERAGTQFITTVPLKKVDAPEGYGVIHAMDFDDSEPLGPLKYVDALDRIHDLPAIYLASIHDDETREVAFLASGTPTELRWFGQGLWARERDGAWEVFLDDTRLAIVPSDDELHIFPATLGARP